MAQSLGAAFAARLAGAARESVGDLVERELETLVARARTDAPGVELDPLGFAGYLAERVTFDRHGAPVVSTLFARDLWIAYGCVIGDPAALAMFETAYAPEIASALHRAFDAGLAADAELRFKERLLLVEGDANPRLASYAGRGDLRAWLRAGAARTAIDLMRARREVPADTAALSDEQIGSDPLLAGLKQRYRDEFRTALHAAGAELSDRDRTLLRYRFIDDLSIDEIGLLYRVHRATVARWIAAVREALFEGTRTRLMQQMDLGTSEADSVLRLIDSQLDVSIETLVRPST